MAELTTTSYSLLGLLALRDWSTYELAQQMQYSLHFFWPRTERQLYEQPKLLVARGLAEARNETVGKRPRTVYRITPTGRRALSTWLSEPGRAQSFEWEALVKVFFAESSTKHQLLAHLYSIRETVERASKEDVEIARERVGDFEFPERLHLSALVGGFLFEQLRATQRWVEWAIAEVDSWPDIGGPRDLDRLVHDVYGNRALEPEVDRTERFPTTRRVNKL
jgi:PadR family transcriptional regulator AphA